MKKIVLKFGGSNLKTKTDIQRILRRIREYDRPLVIIVSAFFGITDFLTEGIDRVKKDETHIPRMIQFLKETKKEAILENLESSRWQNKAEKMINNRLDELEKYLLGIHYIGDVPDFVKDRILSYGERLSSLLLTMILQEQGLNAVERLPEEIGLLTDGKYNSATVNFSASTVPVSQALSDEKIFVIPGFYGLSPEGKVNLLGRGGSDYSAAAIARCIDAESLDIWKDVDGYRTADPRLVRDSRKIEKLSYREAAELSYFGAKILHPRTVEPLVEKKIPIRIFNIEKTETELSPLSIIQSESTITPEVVKSVTCNDQFGILKLNGPGVGIKPGILSEITTLLHKNQINIMSVVTSQTVINLYLDAMNLQQAYQLIKEEHPSTLTAVTLQDDLSIIAAVGEGMIDTPHTADQMISAIAAAGIRIRMISMGASDVAVYILVPRKERDQAVQVVHKSFFSGEIRDLL